MDTYYIIIKPAYLLLKRSTPYMFVSQLYLFKFNFYKNMCFLLNY